MKDSTVPSDIAHAVNIMLDFAERTGLSSGRSPRRYLWTDAFAVCNFLGLYEATGDDRFKALALALIDQVHTILGRHRPDDTRTGWISGLSEAEGRARPLAGGLRIGKALNERARNAAPDARLEWEQDGQYFHYLTKWVHALVQAGTRLGEARFIHWAAELSEVAHRAFLYEPVPDTGKRMYWKMRIDLSAPLVSSMGQHDPLDGLVTCRALQHAAKCANIKNLDPNIEREIEDYRLICQQIRFETDDPLGLGGLLFDALRLAEIGWASEPFYYHLSCKVLGAAAYGLKAYLNQRPLDLPAHQRLAFREIGLAIGLVALERIAKRTIAKPDLPAGDMHAEIELLSRHIPLGRAIERTWLKPDNQQVESWIGHQDINAVMLATCLIPDGFLSLDM